MSELASWFRIDGECALRASGAIAAAAATMVPAAPDSGPPGPPQSLPGPWKASIVARLRPVSALSSNNLDSAGTKTQVLDLTAKYHFALAVAIIGVNDVTHREIR